jgi:hypothetical protein
MSDRCLLLTVSFLTVLLASDAFADAPHVSYIFPAGGQRGTSVNFKVGGHNLHEGCPFEMRGQGIKASDRIERTETIWFEGPVIPLPASQRAEDYAKDYLGQVHIANDAELGNRYWRVSTSQGVTTRMKFVIGELPEVIEEEIDGAPIPVAVTLPVTINGRIFPREDVDIWTFEAKAGQEIICEVNAARIGSPLDSRIEIRGDDGQPIAENVDALGADSFVHFKAPYDGRYQCRIHDINFSGLQNFVYRLTIRSGAFIQSVYPLGGRAGEDVQLKLTGVAVPGDAVSVALPSRETLQGRNGFAWRLDETAGQSVSNGVWLDVGTAPEMLEVEPNDPAVPEKSEASKDARPADIGVSHADTIRSFTVPATLNGRIEKPGDVDLWRFSAEAGKTLQIEVLSARLGTPLDSVLSVLSLDGSLLTKNDDAPGGVVDSRLSWKVPNGEAFYVQIQDQLTSRGDERFAYRIRVTEVAAQSFAIELPSEVVAIDRGGETKLKLNIDRSFGYAGEIELSVENLPEGVTLDGTRIGKGRPNHQLTIKVADSAKTGVASVRLIGKAVAPEKDNRKESEEVPDLTVQAVFPVPVDEPVVDTLMLAVTFPTPFKFTAPFETKYASRGTVYSRKYHIERNGFEGQIEIELADRQNRHLQGVKGEKVVVPPGESEFEFAVTLPPWMEIGRTSRTCLIASAWAEDETGGRHRVSYSSQAQDDQVIVLVDPVRLSIETPRATLGIRTGEVVDLPITVNRGPGLTGPVTVRVLKASHIKGCSAEPVTIPAGEGTGVVRIKFAEGTAGPFNAPLILEASIQDARDLPVTSEFPVVVRMLD